MVIEGISPFRPPPRPGRVTISGSHVPSKALREPIGPVRPAEAEAGLLTRVYGALGVIS